MSSWALLCALIFAPLPPGKPVFARVDNFGNSKYLVGDVQEPCDESKAWIKGMSSSGRCSRKAMRILMAMGMLVDVFNTADMKRFTSISGGVECHPQELSAPE